MNQKTNLQQLDPNFQVENAKENLHWIDAFDESLALRGLAWLPENRPHRSFRRTPERPELEATLSEGVRVLSHNPASAFLSFFTDSPELSVRIELHDTDQMSHMPATGQSGAELYFRAGPFWHAAATARPTLNKKVFEDCLITEGRSEWREYRLYLPLYQRMQKLEIGINRGARIEPSLPTGEVRPIVFYGTSITQGGCASTTGSDYVSQIGRLLDTEVINLGFSGSGKGEPVMAELISEINAGMFVLDYVANVQPGELCATLPAFVSILRRKHPTTPIVLLSCVTYNQTLWDQKKKESLEETRDTMMEFYLAARKAGDAHIHFVDGNALLVAGQSGLYVDGVHPTSAGFSRMAEILAPQLSTLRLWENQR